MKMNGFVFVMLAVCCLLCGCTAKFVWTDDVVGYSGSLCSWGKVDDLAVDVNDTNIQAGGVEHRPDANSVDAAVHGAVTAALGGAR